MPHISESLNEGKALTFPPVTKDQIQNCSYDAWFPKYRSSCIRSRIIQLTPAFISYLHEDGIILADDDASNEPEEEEWSAATNTASRPRPEASDSSDEDEDEEEEARVPPNHRFPEIHNLIKEKIKELGGAVVPKLNWSSPQDAKWISQHQNTLKCTTPNDIYLLLKASPFISHDLSQAFEGCTEAPPSRPFSPILVLRSYFNLHVALEFRCFVKHRCLIAMTQRDRNYYEFLETLRPKIWKRTREFFNARLKLTFPDSCFAFDIYVPEDSLADDGLGKVRLMDINPWAPRTDSILFHWEELIEMEAERPTLGSVSAEQGVRIGEEETTSDDLDEDDEYRPDRQPEMRIVEKDDPDAYNFSSTQFSAHKLPKEVVDASLAGEGGLREFAQQWKEITEGRADGVWQR